MLVGSPPFHAESQMDTYHKIMRGKYKVPNLVGKRPRELITRLLVHNPSGRIGTQRGGSREVLEHSYFEAIDWRKLEARHPDIPMPYVPRLKDQLDTQNFDFEPSPADGSQWDVYNDSA